MLQDIQNSYGLFESAQFQIDYLRWLIELESDRLLDSPLLGLTVKLSTI